MAKKVPSPAEMKAAVEAFKKKFTGGFYHGSPSNKIKAFDSAKKQDPDFAVPGVTFVTRDPDFADSFLPTKNIQRSMGADAFVNKEGLPPTQYKTGATMYPVSVNLGKHFDPSSEEAHDIIMRYTGGKDNLTARDIREGSWTAIEHPNFLNHLKKEGFDTFTAEEGGIPNVGIFDPKNIRGKFAKFNPEDADSPDFMKAEGGAVQHFQLGGSALKLAKQIAPKFSLEAIKKMPVSSAQKQTPVAKAFQMLSSENVDPNIKQQIFKQYLQLHPDLVRKSGATNYDELTQAAYQQMAKETRDQFQAIEGAGVKMSWDPTGAQGYKSSKEMLEDALGNKHLTVFQGGEPHPGLSKEANEQFRAAHDYFGHGTTGASFGPKGEELAYGAHAQMYSPLAKLAAATETRGQNSFANYSGVNEELIGKMNQLKNQRDQIVQSGGDPSAINDQLLKMGQQWQYAPQKPLILPPEQLDLQYKGYALGGKINAAKKALEHARKMQFVHFSNKPDLTHLDPNMYGTGIKGQEAARLKSAPDIRPRSYIYADKPNVRPEAGLGPHKYSGVVEDIYPLHEDPAGYGMIAKTRAIDPQMMQMGREVIDQPTHLNELERLIKEAGYGGYANDDVGLLFHPTQVQKVTE